MSNYNDITSLCNELRSNLRTFANEVSKAMNEEVPKALEEANKEFGQYQKDKIKGIFNKAIDNFYEAYTPQFYERNLSLYDILKTPLDSHGMVDYDAYSDLYDESKVTPYRNGGNGLFDKAFMNGWHGGAESGDGHPNSGTPYYRAPYKVYKHWSRSAVKSTAPATIFERDLSSEESSEIYEKFCEISNRHNEQAMRRINEEIIPSIKRKIYG